MPQCFIKSLVGVIVVVGILTCLFILRYGNTGLHTLPLTRQVVNYQRQSIEQEWRRSLLRQKCAVHFNNSNSIKNDITLLADELQNVGDYKLYILTDPRRKYMYCVIPKVACTLWKQSLAMANGAPHNLPVHSTQINKYLDKMKFTRPQELGEALATRFKFLFVRHPFERLVSAYRDKLVKDRMTKFTKSLTELIKGLYRPGCQLNISACAEGPATFNEFVQYLIDPRTKRPFNRHWLQFHELCQPCFIDYDFIGNYETFDDDRLFVLQKIGIDKLVIDIHDSSKFSSTPQPQRSPAAIAAPRTSELVARHFAEVSPEDVEKLRQVYRIDFDLFGYN